MTEPLIEFETAKLAKEKEFDFPCLNFYDKEIILGYFDLFQCENRCSEHNNSSNPISISAPTQALLQKWLREEHSTHVDVHHNTLTNNYRYSAEEVDINPEDTECKTYEQALEKGLQEALKLIKL